jgi:hypothetical protein
VGDNIKKDFQKIGWGDVDFIDLKQDMGQVAGFCESGNEPSGFVKCWASLDQV